MKEEFYNKLSDLDQQHSARIDNTWATGHGINQVLETTLSETVHIIHPDLSSIHSPIDSKDYSGIVNYIEAMETCIKEDDGELKKPIIAIWNTNDIRQKEGKINYNAEGGSHWQTMVVLSKNHILQDGSPLNNDKELVFFKDSYYKGCSIPNLMKFLFKNKMVVEHNLKEGEGTDNQHIEIGGRLAQAEIIEQKGKDIIQQVEGYDCGWWAVYNALMFIAEGKDSFLDQFKKAPIRELGYKLRGIFGNENLSLTEIGAKQKSQAQDNNLWVGLEEALHASLIEKLKKEEGYEALKEKIKKLDTDYLGMLSFIQSNEGARLEESYRTVMDIIEDDNQGMQLSQVLRTPKKKFILDNKWSDYVESSQLKEKVIKEYGGMLKKDVVLDQTYDDFVEFVGSGNIYVDKTLFIKHVLDNGNHLLITCPRRWGKSLNLSMLKAFLQPDGEDETHYKNNKYDFSVGNKHKALFEGGKIITNDIMGEEKELTPLNIAIKEKTNQIDYLKYQGQYPVIYLNLKGAKESSEKGEGYTEHNLDAKLRSAISDAYKDHKYLYRKMIVDFIDGVIEDYDLNSYDVGNKTIERLWTKIAALKEQHQTIDIPDNLKKLKAYYNGNNIPEAPLAQSIKFLSDLLREYYGRKVFVLVDEFDKPVNDILSRGNFLEKIEEAKQIAKMVSDIIAPCSKGISPSTKQIVLTGILNSEVQEGSSEINNLDKEGVMTGQLASYFGFNDEEVNWVLEQAFTFKNDYKELLFDQLKYWYNGQIIGQNIEVFTPSSVMKYLMSLKKFNENPGIKLPKFKSYWANTETTSMLKSFATIAKEKDYEQVLEKLVKISYQKDIEFNYNIEKSLYKILNDMQFSDSNSSAFEELIFHYMLRSGYITKIAGTSNQDKYKLPAREVERIFVEDVMPIWKSTLYINKNQFQDIVKEIDFSTYNAKDVDEKMTNALQYATIKYSALGEEGFRIILNDAIENSKIKSKDVEISSGTGRADLIYYYKGDVLIYELKYHNNKADGKLEEAIKQIYTQNYMDKALKLLKLDAYKKLNIKTIKLIPVVMYREGNNTEWQYKTGNVKMHSIEEAQNIVQKMQEVEDKDMLSEHLAEGNNIEDFADRNDESDNRSFKGQKDKTEAKEDKLSLTQLIKKINASSYTQKQNLIIKLKDAKKEDFTKKEALEKTGYGKQSKGYKLIEGSFKDPKKSKNKKGYIQDNHNEGEEDEITYKSEELEAVLKKRLADENIKNVAVLPTYKSYEEYGQTTESYKVLSEKVYEALKENYIALLSYAEEDHFIGIIFKKDEDNIAIGYMDSDSMNGSDYASFIKFKAGFESYLIKQQQSTNFQKIKVSQQKYLYNCGIETIENFIGYLKGEDLTNRNISQDKAIEIHKVLGESKALNNPFVSEDSIKTLEDTMSMFERLGIEKPKKRTWKEFKEMHGIKDDSPYMMKRMLKKTIPNNKKLDDILKNLKGLKDRME